MMSAIPRVISVQVQDRYTLTVTFDDGSDRMLDLEPRLFRPVFEPLRDQELFRKVIVDPELGTIVWPNGADLSPEFLYDEEQSPTARAK
jgi:Protein of unknown function (DUF2442)